MSIVHLCNLGSGDSGETGEEYCASTAPMIYDGKDGVIASTLG